MTIHEVSERTGLTPDTLRWYEKIGLLAPVRKTGGKRNYSEREVRWIGYIKCMRRAALPVDAILEYIRIYRGNAPDSKARRRAILVEQYGLLKKDLEERRQALDYLRLKIDWFDGRVSDFEAALKGSTSGPLLSNDPELADEIHARAAGVAPAIRHPNAKPPTPGNRHGAPANPL